MSVSTPASTPTPSSHRAVPAAASRASTWSLLMLAMFVLVYFVTGVFGEYVVLGWLGLPEGSLFLMHGGILGWFTEVVFAVALVAAPAAGVWFAVRALHRGGRWPAWTGLLLNGLLVLVVVYMFVDAIHMSYFAPLD